MAALLMFSASANSWRMSASFLAAASVSTAYRQAVPLCLLVLIILFRPQGLLGRKEERAV